MAFDPMTVPPELRPKARRRIRRLKLMLKRLRLIQVRKRSEKASAMVQEMVASEIAALEWALQVIGEDACET